jgi:hypothetical protein
MKTALPAMKEHLVQDCTTLCRLYKITRTDGNVYTFTDHDQNIDTINYQSYLDDGGYIYEAAVGFSPTASQGKNDLSVDNQEGNCFIDSEVITEVDLRFGIWDAADVEIRAVNWANLTDGQIKLRKGQFGNITIKNGLLTVEVLGLSNKLQILLGRTFGTVCDAELGDSRCQAVVSVETGRANTNPSVGINDAHHITPYDGLAGAGIASGILIVTNPLSINEAPVTPGTGTTTGGATLSLINVTQGGYVFNVTSGPFPVAGQSATITGFSNSYNNGTFVIQGVIPVSVNGFYADGFITFTSGVNSGLSFQIKSWDGITLTLDLALFAAPADGDTFLISPGCAHNVFDCFLKFNNLPNHRGFPTIPGVDSILNYPNATG